MKKLTALLFGITIASVSLGQIEHRVGLHAGSNSGTGASYKVEINNKHQFQLVTLPIASNDRIWLSSGISYQRKFKEAEHWDFFMYGSISSLYTREKGYDWNSPEGTYFETNTLNTSLGLHFEYGKSENFKINFNTGYGIRSFNTDNWGTNLALGIGFDFKLN